MDFTVVRDSLGYLLWGTFPDGPIGGAALTLLMSLAAGVASAVLGTIAGIVLAMSRGQVAALMALVLGFFRAIPVIMLIFWTYFLLPMVFDIDVPAIATVICALTLISAAYLAHSVSAGIRAIAVGQWLAGLSLGFTRWEVLRHIVLPQALRMMTPSFINQWIALIKDTSLAYIVGVGELTFLATQVNNRSMIYPTEIFLFIAGVYLVFCASLDIAAHYINQRLHRVRRVAAEEEALDAPLSYHEA